MKTFYKLFFLGSSIILFTGCSTMMVPRGWKHKSVKQAHPTTLQADTKKKKIYHGNRKHISKKYVGKSDAVKKKTKYSKSFKSYKTFKSHVPLRKSYKVYKNKKLLAQANTKNTKLKIDVSDQRIRLLVNNCVALDAPCTTGAKHKFEPNTKIYRDKRTPLGRFKIIEKIHNKRSTIFGDYYRGKKRVYHGDRTKFRGSKKGLRYEGAALKNWMRLTSGGIGLHASKYVKRHPGTNGCIRLPYAVSKTIFKHVRKGTVVSVVN